MRTFTCWLDCFSLFADEHRHLAEKAAVQAPTASKIPTAPASAPAPAPGRAALNLIIPASIHPAPRSTVGAAQSSGVGATVHRASLHLAPQPSKAFLSPAKPPTMGTARAAPAATPAAPPYPTSPGPATAPATASAAPGASASAPDGAPTQAPLLPQQDAAPVQAGGANKPLPTWPGGVPLQDPTALTVLGFLSVGASVSYLPVFCMSVFHDARFLSPKTIFPVLRCSYANFPFSHYFHTVFNCQVPRCIALSLPFSYTFPLSHFPTCFRPVPSAGHPKRDRWITFIRQLLDQGAAAHALRTAIKLESVLHDR